jgi:hypothetical protein
MARKVISIQHYPVFAVVNGRSICVKQNIAIIVTNT